MKVTYDTASADPFNQRPRRCAAPAHDRGQHVDGCLAEGQRLARLAAQLRPVWHGSGATTPASTRSPKCARSAEAQRVQQHDDVARDPRRQRRLDARFGPARHHLEPAVPRRHADARVGDTTTASLPWWRSTRIGGIQLSRNFRCNPIAPPPPLPAFLGAAAALARWSFYINGHRRYTGQNPAGLPAQHSSEHQRRGQRPGGSYRCLRRANDARFLAVRHATAAAGGPGPTWSVDLGMVRKNYGLRSSDYGSDPAATGTWRYGVSNGFHAGGARRGATGRGQGWRWRRLVARPKRRTCRCGGSQSSYQGERGSLLNLGYSWRDNQFNFAVEGKHSHTRGIPRCRISLQQPAAARPRAGRVDRLHHEGLRRFRPQLPLPALSGAGGDAHGESVYWFRAIGKSASMNVSLNQNLDNRRERSLFVVLYLGAGRQGHGQRRHQRDRGQTASTPPMRSEPPCRATGGIEAGAPACARAAARTADRPRSTTWAATAAPWGRHQRCSATTVTAYAGATGSIAFMGRPAFAARRIDDAFAGGLHRRHCRRAREAGEPGHRHHGRQGHAAGGAAAVLPEQPACRSISMQLHVFADVKIERVKTVATPSDRSGTMVRFGITPVSAAALLLVDEAGKPLPLGSRVRANGQDGEPALVGFDGAVYLESLQAHNTLDVQTPGGACRTSFDYRKDGVAIPQIGRCAAPGRPRRHESSDQYFARPAPASVLRTAVAAVGGQRAGVNQLHRDDDGRGFRHGRPGRRRHAHARHRHAELHLHQDRQHQHYRVREGLLQHRRWQRRSPRTSIRAS